MTQAQVDTYRLSLARCLEDTHFMERFYNHFTSSSPTIREKFSKTDWSRQYQMMVDSFQLMVRAEEKGTVDNPELWRIAVLHGDHGHKIPGWMYENWIESLLEAVKETDPEWDEGVSQAWHAVMRNGIAFMKARRFEKRE